MQKVMKLTSLVVLVGMEILTPISYAIEGVEDVSNGNTETQVEKTVTELEEKTEIEVEEKTEEIKYEAEEVKEKAEIINVESEVAKEPEEKIEEILSIEEEITVSLWQNDLEEVEKDVETDKISEEIKDSIMDDVEESEDDGGEESVSEIIFEEEEIIEK